MQEKFASKSGKCALCIYKKNLSVLSVMFLLSEDGFNDALLSKLQIKQHANLPNQTTHIRATKSQCTNEATHIILLQFQTII